MPTVNQLRWILAFALTGSLATQNLPDPKLTPGAVDSKMTAAKLCAKSFTTRDERHTTQAMKKQVCRVYGIKDCPKANVMELDHLISLELGGADDIRNLWPQMAPDFHQKDKLENRLHKLVCSGKLKLPEAQQCIRADWYACGQQIGMW